MAFPWQMYFNPQPTPNLFPSSVFGLPCSYETCSISPGSLSAFKHGQFPPRHLLCYLQSSYLKHWHMFTVPTSLLFIYSTTQLKCCYIISGKISVIILTMQLKIFKYLSQFTYHWVKMAVSFRILSLADFSFCPFSPCELTDVHNFNC